MLTRQYFVPMLELNYRIRPALQRVGRHGLACDPSAGAALRSRRRAEPPSCGVHVCTCADPSVAASATGLPFFGHASRHLFVPDRHAADLADRCGANRIPSRFAEEHLAGPGARSAVFDAVRVASGTWRQ